MLIPGKLYRILKCNNKVHNFVCIHTDIHSARACFTFNRFVDRLKFGDIFVLIKHDSDTAFFHSEELTVLTRSGLVGTFCISKENLGYWIEEAAS